MVAMRWGGSRWNEREAQDDNAPPGDPLDEVVMLKPVTRRQIENRRTYIRAYMQRRRAAQLEAYLASLGHAPG